MTALLPRTALVTGAARRIGKAIALELASRGYGIALHFGTSRAEAEAAALEVKRRGVPCQIFQVDLAREEETVALIPAVTRAMGPIGVLVNNASVFEDDTLATMSRDSWDRHIETNLRAPLVLAQNFAASLPKDARGAIVNIIDQRVLKPTPQFLSYLVSKQALFNLTRTLAQALGPAIRVNAVAPGPTIQNARQTAEDFARQCASLPLGRGASPEEVASAVTWLIEAQSVTGQMIAVDGGQHLNWQTPDVTGIRE